MAGSWGHITANQGGKLLDAEDANKMLENGGDWWEFAEEAYGMVYWLASELSKASNGKYDIAQCVGYARLNYREGLTLSPGTDGHLDADDTKEEFHG